MLAAWEWSSDNDMALIIGATHCPTINDSGYNLIWAFSWGHQKAGGSSQLFY